MSPNHLLHIEMLCFLYGLAALLAWQMLTGRIPLAGLFTHKGLTRQTSPGRVQLLMATIAVCATYLTRVANSRTLDMPDIDPNWLYVLGGSGGIYTLEKAWAAFQNSKRLAGRKEL